MAKVLPAEKARRISDLLASIGLASASMDQLPHLVLAQYRSDSIYKDRIGTSYHFPKKYFNQLNSPGAPFIYYEPAKQGNGEYFGYGELGRIEPDPTAPEFFYIGIVNYRAFDAPVPRLDDAGKLWESGEFYNAQNAVRRIDPKAFDTICSEGGVDLDAVGVETENTDALDEGIADPFDPSKIKVDRDQQSVFQVLRKISLGEVELQPDFQRNLVWDPIRRSRLIESLLLRIPLPAFYFDGVDSNRWTVVDGLQRLSTLRDFITEKSFVLTGLEYLLSLNGMGFAQLPRGMQRELEETPITLFIIRPDTPPEVKFTIFYRINTGGLVLTPQEIRHALFQGEATRMLANLAESTEFLKATDRGVSDVRMDARECVLRFLAFRMSDYQQYARPDLNSFLSAAMKGLNSMGDSSRRSLCDDFCESMERAHAVFGRWAFRKFDPMMTRRGPVNKALFESWANVLLGPGREKLVARSQEIRQELGRVFSESGEYGRSLSAGTGGLSAVKMRFGTAQRIIDQVLAQ